MSYLDDKKIIQGTIFTGLCTGLCTGIGVFLKYRFKEFMLFFPNAPNFSIIENPEIDNIVMFNNISRNKIIKEDE